MKRITCYKTMDGVIHETWQKAERHADERFGALLTSLCQQLVRVEKYPEMMKFIEEHLEAFVTLAALKKDAVIPPPEEDD